MENKILTTLTLDADVNGKILLADMPRWDDAKQRLLGIIEAAEKGTIADFFSCKVSKGAPFSYQVLANLTFTSAGYIGDKWRKYEIETLNNGNRPSVYEFLCKNLVPLTAEELKALAEKQRHEAEVTANARSYLDTCDLNGFEVTAEGVRANAKILAKFGEEVVDKIIELLNKSKDNQAKA